MDALWYVREREKARDSMHRHHLVHTHLMRLVLRINRICRAPNRGERQLPRNPPANHPAAGSRVHTRQLRGGD